jgi:palmitoyltransferase
MKWIISYKILSRFVYWNLTLTVLFQRLRFWCMVSAPFLAFYAVGIILQSSQNYLVKLGLLMTCYVVLYMAGQIIFDDRLMNLLPISVYLATKVPYRPQLAHTWSFVYSQ